MKMVKKAEERDLWQSINYHFMTDIGEGEDKMGEFLMRHPLSWRSKSKYMHTVQVQSVAWQC